MNSLKKFSILVISSIVILLHLASAVHGQQCPSQKSNRKRQVALLDKLQPNYVIVEATYVGELEGTYRFQIAQNWEKNNGGLELYSDISVDASSEYESCFRKLTIEHDQILMMSEINADEKQYRAIAPPVASKRTKHRQEVWERLCSVGDDMSKCAMRITLPPTTIFYRGSTKLLPCKVESSSEVKEVTWYKDDLNVDSTSHRLTGLIVNSYLKDNSFIIIKEANHIHNGLYKCVARNADGQTATGSTEVTVIGPRSESHFKPCKDPSYCMNGGKCKQFVDDVVKPVCECHSGYVGQRCEQVVHDITASSTKDEDDMQQMRNDLSRMTTVIAVITVGFVCIVLASLVYIVKLRRRLSSSKDKYDVVHQCCSDSERMKHDIEGRRYTSSGTEASSVRLSVIETSGVPDSKRSSYTSPRTSSNLQFFAVNPEEMRPKQSSNSPVNDFPAKGTNPINRQSSTASDKFQKRGRLSAKS